MTVEEKRKFVQKKCNEGSTIDCEHCPYGDNPFCRHYNFETAPSAVIDAWYDWFVARERLGRNVDHPAHYQGKHECIDEMISLFGVDAVIGFCKCNVYKYRYRADKKNGEEDIKKAEWYMDKLMELEKERDS